MQFLSGHMCNGCRPHIRTGRIGLVCTPANGYNPAEAKVWAADNGCFGKGYPGDDGYLAWLAKHAEHASRCVFDVPSAPWDPAPEPRYPGKDDGLRLEIASLRRLCVCRQEQLDLAHEQIGLRDREIARLDWRRG